MTVKRKHITQNRDIIKTNALAQLRIKELEDKVLQMEGERAEKNLEMIRIRANMDRVERASKSMMRGWQLVGAGLAALTSIEGLRIAEPSDRVEQEAKDILRGDANQQQKQGNRITLDPHALPAGVARSVSRPPEARLVNLVEEDSRELTIRDRDDEEEGIDTVVFTEEGNGTLDETTRSVLGDETIRLEVEKRSPEVIKTGVKRKSPSAEISQSAPSRPPIQEIRPDTSLLTPSYGQSQLRHSASIDSLSSFADEEEVQLSDDLCEEDEIIPPSAPISKSKHSSDHVEERRFTKPLKRRESTMSPDRSNETRATTPSELQILSSSDGDSPQVTRSSRRSSARDRKSINYALPKLNTKMRKPDPGDMIPAQNGEIRRKETSSGGEGSGGSIDETPRRALRGGNEVASTGNLREIAMQHQSARKEDNSLVSVEIEQSISQQKAQQRRRRSSSTQSSARASPETDRSAEWDTTTVANEIEDATFTGREQITSSLPPSWKNTPSSINNFTFAKSATNGTPIPKNHAGQNIKALKVANRIQKQGITHAPSLPSSDARSKLTNRPGINGTTNGSAGDRVLHTSAKVNQARVISPTTSENTKRNSLHAAMTLEVEGQ